MDRRKTINFVFAIFGFVFWFLGIILLIYTFSSQKQNYTFLIISVTSIIIGAIMIIMPLLSLILKILRENKKKDD